MAIEEQPLPSGCFFIRYGLDPVIDLLFTIAASHRPDTSSTIGQR
ncbi:MAG: hypothetical protein N838_25490 [Thiohalocapsa sp. PB-PSB1]|jgi:hypothetical protein|nr:MAG: hypothetical protein N838_25490 [Thiohalocapsa sp. PB-PSB1]